jgi:hypothetical protein
MAHAILDYTFDPQSKGFRHLRRLRPTISSPAARRSLRRSALVTLYLSAEIRTPFYLPSVALLRRPATLQLALHALRPKTMISPPWFVPSCSAMSLAPMIAKPSPICSRRHDWNMVLATLASFLCEGSSPPSRSARMYEGKMIELDRINGT